MLLRTEPAGQLLRHTEHADAPAIAENLPASHSTHSPWPAPALYRPGGQLAHELVPFSVKPALHPTEQLRLPGGADETYSVLGPCSFVQALHPLSSCTHTHTRTCTHTHVHTSIYIHTYTHTYVHLCMHTYGCTYIPTYIQTDIKTYTCTYIYTYVPVT